MHNLSDMQRGSGIDFNSSTMMGFQSAFAGALLALGFVFMIYVMWKIFEKAGIKGYKALIPFYNIYLLTKLSFNSGWYFLIPAALMGIVHATIGITVFNNYIAKINGEALTRGLMPVAVIAWLGISVFEIIRRYKLNRNFGKGTGNFVLMLLFQPIMLMILAFDDSKYRKVNTIRVEVPVEAYETNETDTEDEAIEE